MSMSPPERKAPAPKVVAGHFVRQYYGSAMVKKLTELMRFYTEESTFVFESGTPEEAEPVSGVTAIKAKLEHLGLEEAQAIDLGGDDSIDAKPTEEGRVIIKVTDWVTIFGMEPRHFVQTFHLSISRRFTFPSPDVSRIGKNTISEKTKSVTRLLLHHRVNIN